MIIKLLRLLKSRIYVPFTRPRRWLRQTPTIDVIIHALEWYENQNVFFDAVCLLQQPFRTVEFLDKTITKFMDSGL
jgi:hypothetical protein